MADNKELVLKAESYGLDTTWLEDTLKKYGPTVLDLIVDALQNGFNAQFVQDIIDKLGPFFLEMLTGVYKAKVKQVGADPTMSTAGLDDTVFKTLIKELLPVLADRYGKQLLQSLVDAIIKSLG